MTTKHEVIACHRKHPDWHSSLIAAELDCNPAYVRATAARNCLALPCGPNGSIPWSAVPGLVAEAKRRKVTPSHLVKTIIRIVADHDLYAGILDE